MEMVGTSNHDSQNDIRQTSFWECKQYMRTVKRVDTSNKLCSELGMMIHERAEIEKSYSLNLKRWSSKWFGLVQSDMPYSTMAYAWKGLCSEADAISNAHQEVHKILMDEVRGGLKHWQKEHFQKTQLPLNTLKKSKQFEQEFEQAQKPWTKKLKKMQLYKKDYYQACKTERYLQIQVQNAKSEISGNVDQIKKAQEKWEKAVKDVENYRVLYQKSIDDLKAESPRYLEEMTKVFNQTQDFERDRLCYFKSLFTDLHRTLNVTNHMDFSQVYHDLESSISKCNEDADLAWWSSHHGVDMPVTLPEFEEYSPELTAFTNKKKGVISDGNSNVTITNITSVISSPEAPTNGNNKTKETLPNPFDESSLESAKTKPAEVETSAVAGTVDETADVEFDPPVTYDDGRPGVKVRALYDYTGQEDDEISLTAGDVFEKLEEADEQGWCKGRKDGRVGLYPANYAKEI